MAKYGKNKQTCLFLLLADSRSNPAVQPWVISDDLDCGIDSQRQVDTFCLLRFLRGLPNFPTADKQKSHEGNIPPNKSTTLAAANGSQPGNNMPEILVHLWFKITVKNGQNRV